jgi:ferric-dicitrate binding protein FerR (iron transport regulator)
MKEKLLQIIQEYSEGKLTLREQIELSEQLADEHNSDAEHILLDDWNFQLESDSYSDRNLKPILDRVHHRIRIIEANKIIKISWWQTFQRIAAILIFPLLISILSYFYFQNKQASIPDSYAEIQCPLGVRTKFQLPDGSTGFLNSGSHLKYPVQFSKERKVELSGEAFFDVVHNEKLPFHVITRNLDIKVLGTTFNVIANEDEESEEIVLQTGKVVVFSKSGKQLVTMAPNEQGILDIGKQSITKNEVVASQYTSWTKGQLVFRNENMQQVARRLSRWYNADVLVMDRMLYDYSFHATFRDEPLDEVLKLLSITTPLSFKEEKRANDQEGVYQKRHIVLRLNQAKINQFK